MNLKQLPKILFISPTIPGGHKNGLSMRAAMWLSMLQEKYDVYLLVIPVADGKIANADLKLLKQCKKVHIALPSLSRRLAWKIHTLFNKRNYTEQILRDNFLYKAGKDFWQIEFEAIHVLRSYLSPAVKPFVEGRVTAPRLSLDLDDIESITNERLAELYQKYGRYDAAQRHQKLSKYFTKLETEITNHFDQIFVCSNIDASRLQDKGISKVSVVPNSLPAQSKKRG